MDYDSIETYKKTLDDNIFTCMEMSRQSYQDVVMMPVKKMFDYLKWKSSLEDSKRKILQEKQAEANSRAKNKRK